MRGGSKLSVKLKFASFQVGENFCGRSKYLRFVAYRKISPFPDFRAPTNFENCIRNDAMSVFYKIKVFKKKNFTRYNYHYNIELLRKLEKDIRYRKYSTMLHHSCLLNRSFILRHLFKFIGRLERRVKGHWPFITRLSTRPREADFLVRGP